MECKITGESVQIFECVFDGSVEQPVDVDFTLPDYCPDIGRILKCRTTPIIRERSVTADGVAVEGTARIEVLYVDGRDKHMRCCVHDHPFTTKLSAELPTGAKAAVSARVDYMNCRATSQRRLDVHGALTLRVSVEVPQKCELTSAIDGAGIKTKCDFMEISSAAGRSQTAFTISEALELPSGKPPIAAVTRSGAVITVQEQKPIANKLIVKGTAELELAYCSDSGDIERMSYSIPFSQFFDVGGADDECQCAVRLGVSSIELGLRTDSDGEYRRISADVKCFADIRAYREERVSVVSDAYSTEFELAMETKKQALERYLGEFGERTRCDASLEFGAEISEVLDNWCDFVTVSSVGKGGVTLVSGSALLCAVVRSEEGDCEYSESICRFECECPAGCDADQRTEATAFCSGCGYSLNGRNKLDMRADIAVVINSFEKFEAKCVLSAQPDENRKKRPEDKPAMVMYFAEAGEELWDIAREYNSSAEDIMTDNNLFSDRLPEDRLLLISGG